MRDTAGARPALCSSPRMLARCLHVLCTNYAPVTLEAQVLKAFAATTSIFQALP